MEKEAFEVYGKVEACLVAHTFGSLVSTEVEKIQVIRAHGVRGDRHAGSRLADVREHELLRFGLPKGIEVVNLREFSMISTEELVEITRALWLPLDVALYGYLGENFVISGIPKLTQLPHGTKLFFEKPGGQKRTAVLQVCGENAPCALPGKAMQEKFPHEPDIEQRFPKAAVGKRGVVGQVFASGNIHKGDTVLAMVPHQRIYDPN